jgi:hypothetical protein
MNKRQQKKKVTPPLLRKTATAIGSTLGAIARRAGIAKVEVPPEPVKAKRAARKQRTA